MRNTDSWSPTKYIIRKGKLVGSRDRSEVGAGSQLMADLVAEFYDLALKKFSKGRLLDLGCGKAPLYLAYKDHATSIICADWPDSPHQNLHLDLNCDLSRDLPFKSAEFDTIILSDVLEHIPTPDNLCNEVGRMLAPGGKLLLNVPFYYCLHEQPHDYHRYSEHALRRFMSNAGISIIDFKAIGGSPEVIADLFAKHLQFVPVVGPAMAIALQTIVSTITRTPFGKKISARTSKAFPFGYALIGEKRA